MKLLLIYYLIRHKKKETNYNVFYGSDSEKRNYIENMIYFLEILEENSNIDDIELKYQGAILVLTISFFGKKKLLKLISDASQ